MDIERKNKIKLLIVTLIDDMDCWNGGSISEWKSKLQQVLEELDNDNDLNNNTNW